MMGILNTNLSKNEIAWIIEAENKMEVERLMPLIVYLVVFSVTGTIGNGLVCYIYHSMRNTSSSRRFVFFLGVVDLFMCVIALPIEILKTFQQFNFSSVVLCKINTFFNMWTILSIGLILVIVAVDRYRKICTPYGWQINTSMSKVLCGVLVGVAFVMAVPIVFVYKIHKVKLPNTEIFGNECSYRTENNGHSLQVIYLGFGVLFCVCSLLTICIAYCCIGVVIMNHAKKGQTVRYQGSTLPLCSPDKVNTSGSTETIETETTVNNENAFTGTIVKTYAGNNKNIHDTIKIKRLHARKATFSMLLITLTFVIGFVPSISLILTKNFIPGLEENMSDEMRVVYKFFICFIFTPCAMNPFLFAISDSKFKQRCKDTGRYLRVFFSCVPQPERVNE